MSQHKRRGKRELARRQVTAEVSRINRVHRTDAEQIEILTNRRGNSVKEIARLSAARLSA